jgi:hypothetical protein
MDIKNPHLLVGVFGLGMVQIVSLYENTAPSLQEVRQMQPGDVAGRQELLDTNLIVGSITALVAIMSWYATGSALPFVMLMSAFAMVAGWRYLVLYSPNLI